MFFSTLSFYDNFAENVVIFVVMSLAFFQPKYLKCDLSLQWGFFSNLSVVGKSSSKQKLIFVYYTMGLNHFIDNNSKILPFFRSAFANYHLIFKILYVMFFFYSNYRF